MRPTATDVAIASAVVATVLLWVPGIGFLFGAAGLIAGTVAYRTRKSNTALAAIVLSVIAIVFQLVLLLGAIALL